MNVLVFIMLPPLYKFIVYYFNRQPVFERFLLAVKQEIKRGGGFSIKLVLNADIGDCRISDLIAIHTSDEDFVVSFCEVVWKSK